MGLFDLASRDQLRLRGAGIRTRLSILLFSGTSVKDIGLGSNNTSSEDVWKALFDLASRDQLRFAELVLGLVFRSYYSVAIQMT
jgi:hypothetical protein